MWLLDALIDVFMGEANSMRKVFITISYVFLGIYIVGGFGLLIWAFVTNGGGYG